MVKKAAQATPNQLLRWARLERGWTQKVVADRIGAPNDMMVTRWERGTAFPSAYYIERLCQLFEQRASDLGLLPEQPSVVSSHPLPDRQQPGSSEERAHPRTGTTLPFPQTAEPQENAHEGTHMQPWRSTLPIPLTSFFGRVHEVESVTALLRDTSVRLVTLTGPGGVGKTRLALSLAAEVAGTFADGVCFVSLASISDPEQVLPAIAQALGLWEAGNRPLSDHVRDFLCEKHLLLLLDNFEQVAAASPQVATLALSCPHLCLLITSRAALHLSGEYEFPVPPLPTPDLTQLPELQFLVQVAAVRLFVERAHAILPSFELTLANARAIAEICVRLDGLPLAIELAAARIKLLPPQALIKRLEHQLDILTDGARDLPTRQQTLRNTIQWSYDLLSHEESRLFRRLSVFVGGCTLQAATAVAQADDYAGNKDGQLSLQVVAGLTSLIDKSLLQQTELDGEEPRLVMLEMLREYGLERLCEQGELETARLAYTAYYLALVEKSKEYLFSRDAGKWLDLLEREYENIRAALLWALERENEEVGSGIETGVRLGSVLWRFWTVRGHLSEGRSMLERLFAASEKSGDFMREKTMLALGTLLWHQGDYVRIGEIGEEQLSLCQQLGDKQGIAHTLIGLSGLAVQQRNYALARSLSEESLTICRAIGDTWRTATVLLLLGRMTSAQGEHDRAQQLLEESQTLYRTLGYAGDIAWPLIYLARNALIQGEHKRTRSWLEEALALCREAGNKPGLAHALSLLGQDALEQGDVARAYSLLTECHLLNQEAGIRHNIARSFFLMASVCAVQGNTEQARFLYEQSLTQALEHPGLIAPCLEGLAAVATAQGQPTWAARLWGAAENVRQGDPVILPQVLRANIEQARATTHTLLGDAAFTHALTEGRTMTLEHVLAAQGPMTTPTSQQARELSVSHTRKSLPYPAGLTTREVQVLRLVAQGLTDAQVAEQLVISHRTVTTHLSSIYNKLDINSRAAAARFAAENKLLS